MDPEEQARLDALAAAEEFATGGTSVPDPFQADRTGETQDALNEQFAAQQAGYEAPELTFAPDGSIAPVSLDEIDKQAEMEHAASVAEQRASQPVPGTDGLSTLINERYWQPQPGRVIPGGIGTESDTYTHAAETALPGKEPQYDKAKAELEDTEGERLLDQRIDAMKRADAAELDKTQAVAQVRNRMAKVSSLEEEQRQRRADADRMLEPVMAAQSKMEEEASKQDPNAVMGVSGGFAKFVAGIGVAMGAGAATLAGGPNHALDFLKSMMQQKAEDRRLRMQALGDQADVALKTLDAKYMNPVAADHAVQAAWAAAMEADFRRKASTAQTQDERIRLNELANEMAVHRDEERKKAFAAEHQVLMRNMPARVVGAHPGGIQGLLRLAKEMGIPEKDRGDFVLRALADPNSVGVPGSAAEGIRERGSPDTSGAPKTLAETRMAEAEMSRRVVIPENLRPLFNGKPIVWYGSDKEAQQMREATVAAANLMEDLPRLRELVSKGSWMSPTDRKIAKGLVERNKAHLALVWRLGAITKSDQELIHTSSADEAAEANLYDDVKVIDAAIGAAQRSINKMSVGAMDSAYAPPTVEHLVSQPVRERPKGSQPQEQPQSGPAPRSEPEPARKSPAPAKRRPAPKAPGKYDHLDPTVAAAMTPYKEP